MSFNVISEPVTGFSHRTLKELVPMMRSSRQLLLSRLRARPIPNGLNALVTNIELSQLADMTVLTGAIKSKQEMLFTCAQALQALQNVQLSKSVIQPTVVTNVIQSIITTGSTVPAQDLFNLMTTPVTAPDRWYLSNEEQTLPYLTAINGLYESQFQQLETMKNQAALSALGNIRLIDFVLSFIFDVDVQMTFLEAGLDASSVSANRKRADAFFKLSAFWSAVTIIPEFLKLSLAVENFRRMHSLLGWIPNPTLDPKEFMDQAKQYDVFSIIPEGVTLMACMDDSYAGSSMTAILTDAMQYQHVRTLPALADRNMLVKRAVDSINAALSSGKSVNTIVEEQVSGAAPMAVSIKSNVEALRAQLLISGTPMRNDVSKISIDELYATVTDYATAIRTASSAIVQNVSTIITPALTKELTNAGIKIPFAVTPQIPFFPRFDVMTIGTADKSKVRWQNFAINQRHNRDLPINWTLRYLYDADVHQLAQAEFLIDEFKASAIPEFLGVAYTTLTPIELVGGDELFSPRALSSRRQLEIVLETLLSMPMDSIRSLIMHTDLRTTIATLLSSFATLHITVRPTNEAGAQTLVEGWGMPYGLSYSELHAAHGQKDTKTKEPVYITVADGIALCVLESFPVPSADLRLSSFEYQRFLPGFTADKTRSLPIMAFRYTEPGYNFSLIPGAYYHRGQDAHEDRFMTLPSHVFIRTHTSFANPIMQYAGRSFRTETSLSFDLPVTYPAWPGNKRLNTSVYSRLAMVPREFKASAQNEDYYSQFLSDVKKKQETAPEPDSGKLAATSAAALHEGLDKAKEGKGGKEIDSPPAGESAKSE